MTATLQWSVRAFTGPAGGGSSVRVVLHDGPVPEAKERQRVATANAELATAFVAADRLSVELHNRKLERRFIGHALLGTAAALADAGLAPTRLMLPVGAVTLWRGEDGMWWLHGRSAWSPNDRHRQVATPQEVDALTTAPPDEPVQVWAWLDEAAGHVRARQFAPSEGKPEDEACGSASMVLAQRLGRNLVVHHGRHSLILAKPRGDGVDLGGTCVIDERPRS
jgi:predicted PhzF superfamily epimerase YddE/YHI9